jgi:hypothetical protein
MKKVIHDILILLLTGLCGIPLQADTFSAAADCNGNGVITMDDFQIISSSWMTSLPWWPDGPLPKMIAHWALDLDAMDSQFMFDGTCVGNPVWFSQKTNPNDVKIGSGSIGLYGQDYIEIDASNFPHFYGSLTVDVWIKTGYSQQSQTIISKRSNSWKLGIEGETGKAFFSCPGLSGTNYLAGSTFLSDGYWHHLAAVYDNDDEQIYLYLDGGIDAQASASGQINCSNLNIWIGGNPQTAENGWHGLVDNLRIFSQALTAQQIFMQQTYHVDTKSGSDEPNPSNPEWGKGRRQAFKTIQHAIDIANDGDIILVWPGRYQESLFFMGKAITVRSAADAAWLEPNPDDTERIAVTFMYGEQAGTVLEHFVIVNSDTALWIHQSSPTLRHLTVVRNNIGVESIFNALPHIEHCIFWDNFDADIVYDTYTPEINYSCLQSLYPGTGNISGDPLFVNSNTPDPNALDFHLQSREGRYWPHGTSTQRPLPENWVMDAQTSPCIDAGRPDTNPFCETMNNGGRINLGAYGDTAFAGKSPWPLPADINRNGQVQLEDILLFSEHWLLNASP